LVCIRPASRAGSVQAFKLRPAVLRSTDDIKADGGDGRGDLRGGSFGRPVFAGVRGENLARTRSWPAAELSVWRAARSRGGWPAGPVKLRRLTGPGGRSWPDPGRPKLRRGAGRRRREVGALGEASKKGGAAGEHGASPKCRGGMTGRETGGAARSWREVRSCFWGGGPGRGAKCPVLAGVTQSWRIARSCLKGFTPFRASQDR
jgi:hypothetical protein